MQNQYIYLTLILVFLFSVPVNTAYALEPVKYTHDLGTTKSLKLNAFLKNTYNTTKESFDIALIDLNIDGVDEYILKRKSCSVEKKQCFHMIIAEKGSELLLLSEISAKNLMVAGTSTHGIRDILAFKREINDYDFDIYMWSPSQKTYILKNE